MPHRVKKWYQEPGYRTKMCPENFSVWHTVEMQAIAKDFTYKEYCRLHEASKIIAPPLLRLEYKKLSKVMHTPVEL